MMSLKDARKGARELFRASFNSGMLDKVRVREVLTLLLERRPTGLRDLLQEYQRLIRLEFDRRTARVQTATALSGDVSLLLQSSLRSTFGDELEVLFSVSADLIAGVRVRIGSQVFENSVKDRLDRLVGAVER